MTHDERDTPSAPQSDFSDIDFSRTFWDNGNLASAKMQAPDLSPSYAGWSDSHTRESCGTVGRLETGTRPSKTHHAMVGLPHHGIIHDVSSEVGRAMSITEGNQGMIRRHHCVRAEIPSKTIVKSAAAGLLIASMLPMAVPTQARAASVSEAQSAYSDATKRQEELQRKADEAQSALDALTESIPTVRSQASTAIRSTYKDGTALLDMSSVSAVAHLLGVSDMDDAVSSIQYDRSVTDGNRQSVESLLTQVSDAQTTKSDLDGQLKAAQEESDKAKDALESARKAAQAKAGQTDSSTVSASLDSVNWSQDKESFVAEWAPRLDAYLGKAPLGGYGKVMASAAYDYGVDPRACAAISLVESSKGAVCFRPHNAWGWGGSGWSTWEEAIYAWTSGFAKGYGKTVTIEAARKYCPPTYTSWYSKATREMAKI